MDKKMILSWIFSLILVAVIVSIIDIKQVIKGITKIGLINFLLLCSLYSIEYLFRALRWKAILSPLTNISLKNSFFITNLGFFVNAVLPARAGEFARAYLLSKKQNLGKIKSFSTIILDRIVDGLTLFFFFIVAVFFIEIPKEFSLIILIPAALFFLAFLFFIKPDKFKAIGRIITRFLPLLKGKMKYVFEEMKEAGNIFQAKKNPFPIILYSLSIWIIEALLFYFTASLIGIELTIFHVFLLIVVTGFMVMLPSAPSYIGTFEAGIVLFFLAFGLSENSAISLAVTVHLIQTVVIMLLGFISMKKMKLSFKNISKINFNEIKQKLRV